MPALDGLRGLAILAVILNHYGSFVFTGPAVWQRDMAIVTSRAYVGVDLFFVLSGFLITGILMDSRDSPDYWPRFYWRRSLRIFPAYFFYLLLLFFAVKRFFPVYFLGVHPAWYFTYLSNWDLANNNMAEQNTNPLFAHLWSLAVEEQFYLIWPFVVLLFPGKKLTWFCLGMMGFSLVFRAVGVHYLQPIQIYEMTPARMDALAAGALLAVVFRSPVFKSAVNTFKWPIAAVAFVIWIITLNSSQQQVLGYSAAAVFFAVVVFWAADATPEILTIRPLRTLGKYSYGIYMFHVLPRNTVFHLIQRSMPISTSLYKIVAPLATFAVTLAIAWLSWVLLESRFLRLKDLYFRPARSQ